VTRSQSVTGAAAGGDKTTTGAAWPPHSSAGRGWLVAAVIGNDDDVAHPSKSRIAGAVLRRYPRTYGEELGLRSLKTPAALFKLLVMALLMSARIRASVAFDAATALFAERWTTARAMAAASWEQRAKVLNRAGYARYDERTSTMLGETSTFLIEYYRGDLRRLRDEAGQDPSAERRLLKQCKGIGDVGVDIFFREAQRAWTELYPFADHRALTAGKHLGLGHEVVNLRRLAAGDDFVRLVNGLARVDLDDAYDEIATDAARPTD
jgi:endonuclease III